MYVMQKNTLAHAFFSSDSKEFCFSDYLEQIKKDVEDLLNCHCSIYQWHRSFAHLDRSILSYGLPNYWLEQASSNNGHATLCHEISQMIAHHEPRIQAVSVELFEDDVAQSFILHFHITGVISFLGVNESISLKSTMNPLTKSFSIL